MDACGVALLMLACTLRTYSTLWWWGRIYPGYPFTFAGPQLVMIIGGLDLLLIGAAILKTIYLLAGRRT